MIDMTLIWTIHHQRDRKRIAVALAVALLDEDESQAKRGRWVPKFLKRRFFNLHPLIPYID